MDFIRIQRCLGIQRKQRYTLTLFGVGLVYGLYMYSYASLKPQRISSSSVFKYDGRTILTIFSTWPAPEYTEKNNVRNNTVVNWRKFQKFFTPILFTNDEDLKQAVKNDGWKTLPLTKLGRGNDLAVLKNMYLDAMKYYDSWFYCLASGDILFTDGLIKTLLALVKIPEFRDKVILLIGQRTNIVNVTKDEATNFKSLKKISIERGELFNPYAVDYYITSRNFPWKEMPEVVFGRRGMDTFLVMESIYRNYIVIETTQTILAVHHTSIGGNYENFRKPNKDYNIPLIYKYYGRKPFDYRKGGTICGNYFSKTLNNDTIIFNRRSKSPY